MSYSYGYSGVVAEARSDERAAFIRRTYAHVAGAILAFVGIEALLITQVPDESLRPFIQLLRYNWLFLMLAFVGAGWVAQRLARSETSSAIQYLGLGLYIVVESVIVLPLLYIAAKFFDDKSLIPAAGVLTLAVFGGLTLSVFITRKDYSFLGPILSMCLMIALGVALVACFFPIGNGLGLLFSFAMVALMSGCILYQTSNVMLHYRTDQHVAAALTLFSSVATMFYYILYILMILNGGRGRR
jgi:FtsH-binding integral membrane protein